MELTITRFPGLFRSNLTHKTLTNSMKKPTTKTRENANSNANSSSYSVLCNSYGYPPHGNASFLVGQKNFMVNEWEVFLFQATG